MELSGIPKFEQGVTYLVFVEGNGTALFPVVGGPQGLFQIKKDEATGQDLVLDVQGKPLLSKTVNEVLGLPAAPAPEAGLTPTSISLEAVVHAIQSRLRSP